MKKSYLIVLFLGALFMLWSCNKNNPDEIPYVNVNTVVDLSVPSSFDLQVPGGWIYIAGGNKGIIVFHNFDGNFLAIERTCPYKPFDACNIITVDSSNIFFRCGQYDTNGWQPCCNSKFTVDGFVSNGPATRPLRLYNVVRNGNRVYINY